MTTRLAHPYISETDVGVGRGHDRIHFLRATEHGQPDGAVLAGISDECPFSLWSDDIKRTFVCALLRALQRDFFVFPRRVMDMQNM